MSFRCDLVLNRERDRRAPVVGTAHNFFVEPFQRGLVSFNLLRCSSEPFKGAEEGYEPEDPPTAETRLHSLW
jgi:hypothetical protein